MNGYEKIIKMMQQQSKSHSVIAITVMDTATTCRFNELPLDAEDILIADHLKTGWYKKNGDSMQYIEPVKAGDTVLIVKLSEELYAIVERLVSV